ncbi:MAG: hypothetical protein KAH56_11020, partial [Candidatus Krumholzibacteria bacterium]|nr:hypothetical protein [Candidatus Krumholzibacteria bacterium]
MVISEKSISRLALMMVMVGVCLSGSGSLAREDVKVAEPWGAIIGELRFEGLNRTREYIVTRELVSKVGEPCLLENLKKEKQNLEQLDIFASVHIEAVPGPDGVIVHYEF